MSNDYEDLGIDLDNFDIPAEIAKFDDMNPLGWKVIVRVYTPPKKRASGLYIPDNIHCEEQYRNCTGLVVKIAEDAYKDERYKSPWCKVGDWVIFPRHAGYKIHYKGSPIFVLNEDAIDVKIAKPTYITR
jgi:co-chaperonin GroES (HSP10)